MSNDNKSVGVPVTPSPVEELLGLSSAEVQALGEANDSRRAEFEAALTAQVESLSDEERAAIMDAAVSEYDEVFGGSEV